jgi:hypothetical protein
MDVYIIYWLSTFVCSNYFFQCRCAPPVHRSTRLFPPLLSHIQPQQKLIQSTNWWYHGTRWYSSTKEGFSHSKRIWYGSKAMRWSQRALSKQKQSGSHVFLGATRTPLGVSVLEFSLRIRFQHGAHCNSLFYYCRLVPWREGDKRNPVLAAAAAWPVIAGCIRHNNCT